MHARARSRECVYVWTFPCHFPPRICVGVRVKLPATGEEMPKPVEARVSCGARNRQWHSRGESGDILRVWAKQVPWQRLPPPPLPSLPQPCVGVLRSPLTLVEVLVARGFPRGMPGVPRVPALGAVPRRIRSSLAEFDGRPGKTNPARHKLLNHMMSGGQKK